MTPDAPRTALPTSRSFRAVLWLVTIAFVALHRWHATGQAGGGWNARHGGLPGAIKQFFVLSFEDPVLSAGLSDFAVVATVLGVTMVYDLPPQHRSGWRMKVVLGVYALFPGLGALLFLVWARPAALRTVTA